MVAEHQHSTSCVSIAHIACCPCANCVQIVLTANGHYVHTRLGQECLLTSVHTACTRYHILYVMYRHSKAHASCVQISLVSNGQAKHPHNTTCYDTQQAASSQNNIRGALKVSHLHAHTEPHKLLLPYPHSPAGRKGTACQMLLLI